jgi:hypothetical protein
MASTSLVDGQILQQIIFLERSSESIILFFSKHSVQTGIVRYSKKKKTGIVRCMRCLDGGKSSDAEY